MVKVRDASASNLQIMHLTLTLAKLMAFDDRDVTSLSTKRSRIIRLSRRQTRHIFIADAIASSPCGGSDVFISTASMFCSANWLGPTWKRIGLSGLALPCWSRAPSSFTHH